MLKKVSTFLLALCLFLPVSIMADEELYLGGDSIGIQVQYEGILVSGTYVFEVDKQSYDPSLVIQPKDIIKQVDGTDVRSLDALYEQLNRFQKPVNEVPLLVERQQELIAITLTTVYDTSQHTFRSGLYVKDKIVGVGTLTYYDPSTHTYGALGHEIMDSDLKEIAEVRAGSLYPAVVSSLQKAQNNIPGEKHAQIDFDRPFASIAKNTAIGIYGTYEQLPSNVTALPWAKQSEVTTGSATIYTVVDGEIIEPFQIKITKVNEQSVSSVKGIEFVVDDPRLLTLTNGIIQGMSGSPIVQNGKIIGAVTHVVTSHPLNGYGVYIEWMLQESKNLSGV